MNKKFGEFKISLNELETVPNDPTIRKSKAIIFDFKESGNHQVISKDVAEEYMDTLVGKRICCRYVKSEENGGYDALGGHEQYKDTDRYGNDSVYCHTEAIGFISNVYIDTYHDDNADEDIEAVFADIVLWADDKYQDILGLLQEWLNRGIKIIMSVEYLYTKYIKDEENGIEYILNPVFTAHTVLNSEDRGYAVSIAPSYQCASLLSINELNTYNKVLNSLKSINNIDSNKINNNLKEEHSDMENLFMNALKSMNELAIGDFRDKIMNALGDVMTANEYYSVYVSSYDIYLDSKYFIYESYNSETEKWEQYKVAFAVDEKDNLTIDFEGKTKVEYQGEYVSVNELKETNSKLEETKQSLNSANEKVASLTSEVENLNGKLAEKSTNSKVDVDKFNELTETILALNSKISTLEPMATAYQEKQAEEKALNAKKALEEAKTSFEAKFKQVNALEVFNLESTQKLIEDSVSEVADVAKEAKFSLNNLIVDNIMSVNKDDDSVIQSENANLSINELDKSDEQKDLVPADADAIYEEQYGIKNYN